MTKIKKTLRRPHPTTLKQRRLAFKIACLGASRSLSGNAANLRQFLADRTKRRPG
jgi:hypothetical protein